MRKSVEKFLQKFGQTVEIESVGAVKAMLQPTYFKSQYNMEKAFSAQGVLYKSQYVYIGPVEPAITPGARLRCSGKHYLVRQVQQVEFQDQPAYLWAMCVEVGG